MKYDLIIVGGGPGGLMAARTAAADGLKTLVVERKKRITEINRACSQIFYTRKLSPSGEGDKGKPKSDGYIDPVSVEIQQDKTVFHFYKPGFSLEYRGTIRPYLNWIHLSPSGQEVHRYKVNDRPWGFYYEKETFLEGLLVDVLKAGAEVQSEVMGMSAENVPGGIMVVVRRASGEESLEAKAVIAADGISSRIVESAGFNKNRQAVSSIRRSFIQYIMEGVETGYPACSWLTWLIPRMNPFGFMGIGQSEENRVKLSTLTAGDRQPEAILKAFMEHPRWSCMFRNSRIVKKEVMARAGLTMGPIREPVSGNIVVVGDAGAPAETWIQGAVACGYQAVKAIEKEFAGQPGYPDYIAWWQQAFAFNTPDYIKMISNLYPLPQIASDEEIDYIYKLCGSEIGIPQRMVGAKLETIKAERPALYEKLTRKKL